MLNELETQGVTGSPLLVSEVVIDAVHPLWVLRCQEQFGGTPKDAIRSAFSQPPDAHRNIQA